MYTIVIPTYNRTSELDNLLDSLEQESVHNNEVIILSPMDVVLSRGYSNLSIRYINDNSRINNRRVKSLWAIINMGIEEASNRWVLYLNDDCRVLPAWDKYLDKYTGNEISLVVLKTKGIADSKIFRIASNPTGYPCANYAAINKESKLRFDESFDWFFGDSNISHDAVRKRNKIVCTHESIIIHRHLRDATRTYNEDDPTINTDYDAFMRKSKGLPTKHLISLVNEHASANQIMQSPGCSSTYLNYFVVYEHKARSRLLVYVNGLCKPQLKTEFQKSVLVDIKREVGKRRTKAFLKQFDEVISVDRYFREIGSKKAIPLYQWRVMNPPQIDDPIQRDYDYFKYCYHINKKKKLSVVLQKEAANCKKDVIYRFLEELGKICSYDLCSIEIDQTEKYFTALCEYEYAIVLDDCSLGDAWMENVADCFLCMTYPIYCGTATIQDYFPDEAITRIDINRLEESIEAIKKRIEYPLTGAELEALRNCQLLILDKFNIYPWIIDLYPSEEKKYREVLLLPEDDFVGWRILVALAKKYLKRYVKKGLSIFKK